jgi:hypothetical protein
VTSSLLYARTSITAAAILFAAALYTAALSATPWLALPGLYSSAFFAWCAGRCYTDHRRASAARRRALAADDHETAA